MLNMSAVYSHSLFTDLLNDLMILSVPNVEHARWSWSWVYTASEALQY
jgi:hypothetical protein